MSAQDAIGVILGVDTRPRGNDAGGRIVEGIVKSVSSRGVIFVVPDFDKGIFEYGPAPYTRALVEPGGSESHVHSPSIPGTGHRCLVLFVGTGIDRPWVVSWWPA